MKKSDNDESIWRFAGGCLLALIPSLFYPVVTILKVDGPIQAAHIVRFVVHTFVGLLCFTLILWYATGYWYATKDNRKARWGCLYPIYAVVAALLIGLAYRVITQ